MISYKAIRWLTKQVVPATNPFKKAKNNSNFISSRKLDLQKTKVMSSDAKNYPMSSMESLSCFCFSF